jgi:hypothetical protein
MHLLVPQREVPEGRQPGFGIDRTKVIRRRLGGGPKPPGLAEWSAWCVPRHFCTVAQKPHTSSYSNALRSAALARILVESSVGSGEVLSSMINGISVQPSTTPSQPSVLSLPIAAWK